MGTMSSFTLNNYKSFKAAVLFNSHQDLKICSIKLPNNLEFGQVLVKLKYSGICGAQINEIDAVKGEDKFLPHLLGHEGTGVVKEIGPGVKNVKPGDKVVLHWRKNSGIQSSTPKYEYNGNDINAGWVTTFNELAVVSENRLTKIPHKINLRTATLFGCSLTTAFGVVNNDAKVKIGQSTLVIGSGGVGLNVIQALDLVSAYPIVGLDINHLKLKLAKKCKATHVIKFNEKSLKKELLKINNNSLYDVVFETTGIPKMIEKAYELTNHKGKTILIGVPSGPVKINTLPLHFEKVLKGSEGGGSIPEIDIPNYIKIISQKKLNLSKLITHEFEFDKINDALRLFRSNKAGRILIKF